jgi:hypothetical protein
MGSRIIVAKEDVEKLMRNIRIKKALNLLNFTSNSHHSSAGLNNKSSDKKF